MRKATKYTLIGIGSLAAFVVGAALLVVFLPEKPSSIDHQGSFDVYHFHNSRLGEPGYSRQELWYHGKRLAEYPTDASLHPEQDRILFVNARDAPSGAPDPKGNGIYYFDARSEKQYELTRGKYPSFSNGERNWPGGSTPNPNTIPWSRDGSFAVVSYRDHLQPPDWTFRTESVLFVDLATGAVQNAADLLGVSELEHITFRGWSEDGSLMFFGVGDDERTLPATAVAKR